MITRLLTRKVIIIAIAAALVSGFTVTAATLFSKQQVGLLEQTSLPRANDQVLGILNDFFESPMIVEHMLYSGATSDPHTYGQGYLDLRNGCTLETNIIGALYAVDLKSDGATVWQRSTKRETGSQGNWEVALPLTSNINSPLLGLTGNPSTLYCSLRDISRVLVAKDGGGYDVDRDALAQLLAQRRSTELSSMYVLAGQSPAELPEFKTSMVDVDPTLALLEKIVIEQQSADYMKIIFVGTGNVMLDEISLTRTSERSLTPPQGIENRTDRQDEARLYLGLDD